MNDVLVSIRMPDSLLEKIRIIAKQQHYMDISEQIRSIIRDKWYEDINPELSELKKVRKDIKGELTKRSEIKVQKQVIEELAKIKKLIKEEKIDT